MRTPRTTPKRAPAIGALLSTMRKDSGMDQAELARRSRLSISAIGKLESGLKVPQAATIDKLATAYGVKFAYLANLVDQALKCGFQPPPNPQHDSDAPSDPIINHRTGAAYLTTVAATLAQRRIATAQVLLDLRKQCGYSRELAGRLSDVSPTTIKLAERGHFNTTRTVLAKLARTYQITPVQLNARIDEVIARLPVSQPRTVAILASGSPAAYLANLCKAFWAEHVITVPITQAAAHITLQGQPSTWLVGVPTDKVIKALTAITAHPDGPPERVILLHSPDMPVSVLRAAEELLDPVDTTEYILHDF